MVRGYRIQKTIGKLWLAENKPKMEVLQLQIQSIANVDLLDPNYNASATDF